MGKWWPYTKCECGGTITIVLNKAYHTNPKCKNPKISKGENNNA